MLKIEIKESENGYIPIYLQMHGTLNTRMNELATLIGLMLREYPVPVQKKLFSELITQATEIIFSDEVVEKSRIDLSKLNKVINQEDDDK